MMPAGAEGRPIRWGPRLGGVAMQAGARPLLRSSAVDRTDFSPALTGPARFGDTTTRRVSCGGLLVDGPLLLADPLLPDSVRPLDRAAPDGPATLVVVLAEGALSGAALAGLHFGGEADRWEPAGSAAEPLGLWSDSGRLAILTSAAADLLGPPLAQAIPTLPGLPGVGPAGPLIGAGEDPLSASLCVVPASHTGFSAAWWGMDGDRPAWLVLDHRLLFATPGDPIGFDATFRGHLQHDALTEAGLSVEVTDSAGGGLLAELAALLGKPVPAATSSVSLVVRGRGAHSVQVRARSPQGPLDASEQIANLADGRRITILGEFPAGTELVLHLGGPPGPIPGEAIATSPPPPLETPPEGPA
jgi:hypothetical protein